jgi:uncharacterized membrane protein
MAMKPLVVLALVGLVVSSVGSATAFPTTFRTGDYNTTNTVTGTTPVNNQTTGLFHDVIWWSIDNNAPRSGSADFLPGHATFVENVWYRVTMELPVVGSPFPVNASFQNHSISGDPTSALGSLITSSTFTGSLSGSDFSAGTHNSLGLTNPGEIAVMATGTTVTGNVDIPAPVPEPGTMILAGAGLIMLGYAARRRLFGR